MWCTSAWTGLFTLSGLLCVTFSTSTTKTKHDINCRVLKDFRALRAYHGEIPDRPISGDHLRVCARGLTCCKMDMEVKLATQSRSEFQGQLTDSISHLRLTFAAQAQRFDDFFKELLNTSKKEFHEMFLRTYGMLYDRNSYIFEDLFSNLEQYYLKGGVNLNDALEDFFDKLYRKMFQVLNSQYAFNEGYLNCVSQSMDEMKPFGDVPKKLTVEIKRSFVATRTFVQALVIGRDVVKHLQEVEATSECSRALMRLSKCPICLGMADAKPCANFCLNVMKGCLAYLTDVHHEWTNYINAMMMLASRLESSFNIESVVHPIDIKISDAIMNFQENGQAVSQELFKQCGQPRLGKRDARHELSYETMKFGHPPNAVRPTTAAGTSIDRLVQSITKKIKKSRNFWIQLPTGFCTRLAASDANECWNGADIGEYTALVVGNGIANQTKNPEVSLNSTHHEWNINQQVLTLQLITTKLTHAYNGLDVLWQDSADSDWVSSGSGSGDDQDQEQSTTGYGDIYFSLSTPRYRADIVGPPTEHPPPLLPADSAQHCCAPILIILITMVVATILRQNM